MLVFDEREKPEYPVNLSGTEQRTNKLNPHTTTDQEIEPAPYW